MFVSLRFKLTVADESRLLVVLQFSFFFLWETYSFVNAGFKKLLFKSSPIYSALYSLQPIAVQKNNKHTTWLLKNVGHAF